MDVLVQLLINALIAAGVYALIASGLSVIYATTRVFHLAHGAVIAFAGYIFWYFARVQELHMLLAGILALAAAVGVGLAMNELVYEPLRRRRAKGLGYLISTIALLLFGNAAISALFSSRTQTLGMESPLYLIADARVSLLQIVILGVAAALLLGLRLLMKGTKLGKAMRATADHELVAEVLGIHTANIRRIAFAIGSLLGGIAGVLVALEFNLEPNMGVMLAIKGFAAMVIGGAGSMGGAIAGALILSGAEQAAVWFWGSGWKNAMAFMLLFIFLLAKPTGLFGRKRFT